MRTVLRHLLALGALALVGPVGSVETLPPNFRTLAEIAEQGDADAQYFVGRHFFQNSADPDDAARARDWLTRSAEQDHAHAMLLLAELLELAYGRGEDLMESLAWYARAADLGLAEAQLRLGNFYFKGRGGVEQDCDQALAWYQKAADRGLQVARANTVWLLATCPDDAVRDGRRAVRLGMDIVYRQGMASASNLDNLAAAFAEAGDYRSAWETQIDALEMLGEDHPDRFGYVARLEGYRNRQPWREYRDATGISSP